MLKKTIDFVDYNGEKCSEDFYFMLTKTDILKLEAKYKGGIIATVTRAQLENDNETIMGVFETVIQMAYGQKSPDGKKFIRNEKVLEDLIYSPAYDLLVQSMVNEDEAAKFINAIVPKE